MPALRIGMKRLTFPSHSARIVVCAAALALAPGGCNVDTSRLAPAVRQELETEGVLHEGRNLMFRHTERGQYERSRWRDVVASIVVTKQTLLIHRGEQELLRITPRTRRFCQLVRIGPRLRIQVAGANASETWSFIPPDDTDSWTKDVRSVLLSAGVGAIGRGPAGT